MMAMRGMDMVSATTLLAEIGDLSRFRTPTELMAYLGLVPSEASTGDTVKRGPITKAGNRRARRMLVELSASAEGRTSQATEGRRGAAGGSRDCLEGAVPAVPALSSADQERQAQDRCHRRDRPRACRLHLGCRSRSLGHAYRGSHVRGLARGAKRQGRAPTREPCAGAAVRRSDKSRAMAEAEPRQGEFPIILCGRSQDRRPSSDRDSPRRTNGNA